MKGLADQNHYEILETHLGATLEEIDRAYQLALVTFESFTRARETLISEQHLALEHSTPVVTLWEGMLLMPLMGIIDTQRAQQIIETLLDSIVSTESQVAILDLLDPLAFLIQQIGCDVDRQFRNHFCRAFFTCFFAQQPEYCQRK